LSHGLLRELETGGGCSPRPNDMIAVGGKSFKVYGCPVLQVNTCRTNFTVEPFVILAIAGFDHNYLKEIIRMRTLCSAIDEMCFAIDDMQNSSCPTHLESESSRCTTGSNVACPFLHYRHQISFSFVGHVSKRHLHPIQFLRDSCAGIRLWIRGTVVIDPSS
jgi:hypothetical protein